MLALEGCDGPGAQAGNGRSSSPLVRMGAGSPMRLDPTPVRVALRGLRLVVPANCFDSPLMSEGRDRAGYELQSDILLAAVLPGLECRTKANRDRFMSTGPASPLVTILIYTIGSGRRIASAMSTLYELDEERVTQHNREVRATAEKVREVRARGGALPVSWQETPRTIRRYPDGGFVVCRNLTGPLVHMCTAKIAFHDTVVQIRFAGGFDARYGRLRQVVLDKLEEFRTEAGARPGAPHDG